MKRSGFKKKIGKGLKRSGFKVKKRVKSKTTKKYLAKSAKSWKKKAWEKFSELVRRKANGVCFTCLKKGDWKEMHAGHFIHSRLDLDERNVRCQCPHCNTFLHGNLGNYALHLMEEIGIEGVNQLKKDATLELGAPKKSAEDYKKLYDKFIEELKMLEGR